MEFPDGLWDMKVKKKSIEKIVLRSKSITTGNQNEPRGEIFITDVFFVLENKHIE